MGNLKSIAELIPADERRVILERNLIQNSRAVSGDYAMSYLMVIWREYVEPFIDVTCNACLARVRNNFVGLQDIFIELEKTERTIDAAG